MEPLSIILHLKGHCIESAAKKEMSRLTGHYFNTDDNADIILKKIELLRSFIEKSNFPELRAADARLSGDKEKFVRLSLDNSGSILLDFVD